LGGAEHAQWLCWAARLHEIGLSISHSHYQKHGAYLIDNLDMPGFSQGEQALLAALIRGHRRKLSLTDSRQRMTLDLLMQAENRTAILSRL
jgi:exopolyphosphatase/guanosine-5'-triphosphate,3'-diphosphate pyrophosphatase